MPRIKLTKEKFVTISVEESVAEEIRKNRRHDEPVYLTVRRMVRIYNNSELSDADFVIKDLQELCKRQKTKIDKLELGRSRIDNLERYQ